MARIVMDVKQKRLIVWPRMWRLLSHISVKNLSWYRSVASAGSVARVLVSKDFLKQIDKAISLLDEKKDLIQLKEILLPFNQVEQSNFDYFFVAIAARVNNNAHSLGDLVGDRNEDVAFGIFPTVSMINHSCRPNCVYSGTWKGKMIVRNIVPIKCQEELTVRYCDILQSREMRRADLLAQKNFTCECVLCSESVATSTDQFYHGILCENEACKNQVDSPLSASLFPKNILACSWVDPQLLSIENPSSGTFDRYFTCSQCNMRVNENTVSSMLKNAENELQSALAKLRRNRIIGKDLLIAYFNRYEAKIHPAHHLMASALVPLMNLFYAAGQLNESIRFAQKQVALFDVLCPENYPETAVFLNHIGQLLSAQLKAVKGASARLLLKERENVLKRCLQIRTVAFGNDHPLTLQTVKLLQKH